MTRTREIVGWHFDLGSGWYPAMLEADLEHRAWAQHAVDAVRELAPDAGVPGDIVTELADLRAALMARGSALLQGAVYIRPESVYTIGGVATGDIVTLDDDDDITTFESMLQEAFDQPGPGIRTMDSLLWRDSAGVGEIVGAYQRFDAQELGEGIAVGYERILYGLFPDGSRDMIQIDFTTADLTAFVDMRGETTELVRAISVETEEVA